MSATSSGSVPSSARSSCDALVDQIASHTDGLEMLREIMKIASESGASLDDLRRVIQSDPALSAQIVRRANSRYYQLSYRAADLSQAAALLGFHELRNVALVVFLSRVLDSHRQHGTFHRIRLWHHSLGVAAVAHLVSRICCCGAPADAFAAGLIHDFGYAFLDVFRHRDFGRILVSLNAKAPTVSAERELFGFDHAELGAAVAERLNMSATVADAVRYHHCPADFVGPDRETVYAVAVANYLCSRMGWTSLGVHNVPAPADTVYAGLQLDSLTLSVLLEELPQTMERAQWLDEL